MAGFQILEAGGNALDAGVATGIAINILQSEFTSFGGVGPADAAALATFARLYAGAPAGMIADARPQGRLRFCLIGRIPA